MTPALRPAALALLAVAMPALAREAPVATPAGPPLDCLPLSQIRETRVRDDRTIDFYTSDRKVYRNVLPQQCPELGFEEAFSYETSLSRLCSVDLITVLPRGAPIRGATCGLGKFQPVTLSGPGAR